YDRWKRIQTDQLSPAGIAFTGNAGDGTNLGLEIEAGFAPTPRWGVGAALLLDEPALSRADPRFSPPGDAGLPPLPSPPGGVSVAYTRPLPGGLTGFARADATYVGRSHLTFDDTTARAMGGYLTGGLRAGVETR